MRNPLRARLILAACAGAAAVLVSTGLGWWGWARLSKPSTTSFATDRQLLWQREMDEPLFHLVNRNGRQFLVHTYPDTRFSTGPENLPLEKEAGKTRLLFIGESSAGLSATAVRRIIESHAGLKKFEVLDCAANGGSLVMVEDRFKECSRYSPNIIVLSFGHNLFYPLRPISVFSYWAFMVARRSPLLSRFAAVLHDDYFMSRWDSFDNPSVRWRRLDEFIAQLAAFTRAKHDALILCTNAVNLWVPPELPPDKKNEILYNATYLKARYLYASRRQKAAVKLLSSLVQGRPFAWWRWTLGTWLYRQGDYARAAFFLSEARSLDRAHGRASGAVNDLIRESAYRYGARLVDADLIVREEAPHGIPGWGQFVDQGHLNDPSYLRLAAAILGAVNGGSAPDTKVPWVINLSLVQQLQHPLIPIWQGEDIRSRLWLAMSYAVQSRLAEVLAGGESAAASAAPHGPQRAVIFVAFAQACWRAGKTSAAFRFNEEAAHEDPGWEEPPVQRALFDIGLGRRKDAAQLLRGVLKINPSRLDAAYFLKRASAAS
ncbi:MAG: hypothetical protein KGI84_06045 [Elusimicrobia bacterium]|nr:hypothetical protein [Elusimicrobiota bacterium]